MENFEKGMIYMKILKKEGGDREKGEEETKSMPHAPVVWHTQNCISHKWLIESIKLRLTDQFKQNWHSTL